MSRARSERNFTGSRNSLKMAVLNEDQPMTTDNHIEPELDTMIEGDIDKEENKVQKKKNPSLAESLERGSELNSKLFHDEDHKTVVTDDGSLWLDQGSVSCLNIQSSASVAAPQFTWNA
jgi:hypothetical protein